MFTRLHIKLRYCLSFSLFSQFSSVILFFEITLLKALGNNFHFVFFFLILIISSLILQTSCQICSSVILYLSAQILKSRSCLCFDKNSKTTDLSKKSCWLYQYNKLSLFPFSSIGVCVWYKTNDLLIIMYSDKKVKLLR